MNKTFTLILFLLSNIANATPVTFYFELPDWKSTQPAWPYGDNANVSITLDNGNSSVINQIYLKAPIFGRN